MTQEQKYLQYSFCGVWPADVVLQVFIDGSQNAVWRSEMLSAGL